MSTDIVRLNVFYFYGLKFQLSDKIMWNLSDYRICEMVGVYGEGDFNFRHAFLYLTIINNVSQIVSNVS